MSLIRRRLATGGAGLLVLVAIVAMAVPVIAWWRSTTAQTSDRVERDHGIALPSSAHDVQAMSDTIRILDHGRSSVFVIDSSELGAFVDELDRVPDVQSSTFVPGNQQYQPRRVPWPPGAPERTFSKQSPAGGDFMHVEIYEIDDTRVGVWLYSDWN